MNENNEILKHIYDSANMGVTTITYILGKIKAKENKIKHILENELKEYEEYLKKTEKILSKENIELSEKVMPKFMTKMGLSKEIMLDNSDAKIAHILTEGLTMGVVEISAKIDNYKDVIESKYLKLSKDYLKFQNEEIEKLKKLL